ncbi:MAG: MBL fold metallo-hydrolase [Nitrospinaceae bacterium]|nr:ribonuclease Z [Nitrospinaceae bacterium]NIR57300.1 ribonuclease Z [Nitrospinaceae bacterium]NIS87752.1 ribonuclease Z [Nitrospinaceae bacterium]NIT84622.1 ribonuclease Z [Nitrospinaceae bacterium]NIU46801.1 ribonuclease Z [Nitrospinaceae bacterium]
MGSGTAVPDLQRNSAGYLLEQGTARFLIDCGYGNVHQLLRLGITYREIDCIFLTHHHPDHMCDLIYFLFASKYPLEPRTRDLTLIAGPGFTAYFENLQAAFNRWLTPETYQIHIVEMDEETREFEGLAVTSRKVKHIDMSRGFRFSNGEGLSMAFSGDSDYCQGLVELGRRADLLVLECSTPDDLKVEGHLSPQLCGRIARETKCKNLLLSHFYPPCDMPEVLRVCRQGYDGNIILSKDLTTFEL